MQMHADVVLFKPLIDPSDSTLKLTCVAPLRIDLRMCAHPWRIERSIAR